MSIQELQHALDMLKQNYGSFIVVHDILKAYDGIVFHCANNEVYKWYYNDSIVKLDSWRAKHLCNYKY